MQSTTTLKSRSGQVPQHWRGVLPVHPACDLLPAMTESELRELGDDIKRHGLHTPVVIFTDQEGTEYLLDGRNRLGAMEIVGLPIVIDGELNPDIVHKISGNVDPVAWVLSANLLRRHLTNEQKTELIAKVLELKPNASDRQIAKETRTSHPKVAKVRSEQERRGKISTSKTRTDTKGRSQPARKAKTAVTKAPIPEVEKEERPTQEEDSVASRIIERNLGSALTALSDESIWPSLNAGRKKRLQKALKQLKGAYRELIELAKPAPRRGRPPKARVS
jgi:hypothetical protein